MAFRQIVVPWKEGYEIGVGADLGSGSPKGYAVAGQATAVQNATGTTTRLDIQRIQDTESLERVLGIDVEASYGSAAFGAGVSARFGYASDCKIQSSSLFMAVTIQVQLAFLSIKDPVLTDHAIADQDNHDLFDARYGNMFVRGKGRGGLYVGVMQIFTGSTSDAMQISAELAGSYGLFSADASFKFKQLQEKYHTECRISQYKEGGPTDLTITDVTNPMQILDNANRFLKSFADAPDQNAIAYYGTLAPMEVARGPAPKNAADIQKAQDIIVYCAKRRSALLDNLNLVDFIRDNPARFDYSNGAKASDLAQASQDLQADFDIVAATASAALNDPRGSKMPADFARSVGTVFPKGAIPTLLPLPVSASDGMTSVPDFKVCTTQAEVSDLADHNRVKVRWELRGDAFAPFQVLDYTPPSGTPVPEGSLVTVFRPPTLHNAKMGALVDDGGGLHPF